MTTKKSTKHDFINQIDLAPHDKVLWVSALGAWRIVETPDSIRVDNNLIGCVYYPVPEYDKADNLVAVHWNTDKDIPWSVRQAMIRHSKGEGEFAKEVK